MHSPIKVDVIERLNRNLSLLQAGSIVTIDITTPAGKRSKFRTTFIGYLPKQYVLIQFPDAKRLGGFGQYLTQGTNVTVRGLIEGHEGAIVAFVSPIRQTIQIPSRMMVLEFPKEVSLQALRHNTRIDADVKAKVRIGEEYWQCSILNLSIKGCQLLLSNGDKLLLSKEQAVDIVIENFQERENLKIGAQICNSKTIVDALSVGVQFYLDDKTREHVTRLLHHIISDE